MIVYRRLGSLMNHLTSHREYEAGQGSLKCDLHRRFGFGNSIWGELSITDLMSAVDVRLSFSCVYGISVSIVSRWFYFFTQGIVEALWNSQRFFKFLRDSMRFKSSFIFFSRSISSRLQIVWYFLGCFEYSLIVPEELFQNMKTTRYNKLLLLNLFFVLLIAWSSLIRNKCQVSQILWDSCGNISRIWIFWGDLLDFLHVFYHSPEAVGWFFRILSEMAWTRWVFFCFLGQFY